MVIITATRNPNSVCGSNSDSLECSLASLTSRTLRQPWRSDDTRIHLPVPGWVAGVFKMSQGVRKHVTPVYQLDTALSGVSKSERSTKRGWSVSTGTLEGRKSETNAGETGGWGQTKQINISLVQNNFCFCTTEIYGLILEYILNKWDYDII